MRKTMRMGMMLAMMCRNKRTVKVEKMVKNGKVRQLGET